MCQMSRIRKKTLKDYQMENQEDRYQTRCAKTVAVF